LADSRLLLVDGIINRAATFIPLFLLGFEEGSHIAHLGFVLANVVFIEANLFRNLPRWMEALTVLSLGSIFGSTPLNGF
jgi:hypothetical protein